MVGSMTVRPGGGDAVPCVLGDDLVWRCPDPALRRRLNEEYGPAGYSPADGEPGHLQFRRAADALGGRATRGPRPSPPRRPGVRW